MGQKFLHVLARGESARAITTRLEASGFAVGPSNRNVGGLSVRVRDDSGDEAEVDRIIREVAPGTKYGPPGAPVHDIAGYRESR